ncbi:MAG: phosphoglycerate mutase family protein [Armatimonas sp.]
MPMPEDLYLVRHGESEGNLVNARSRQGDDSLFTREHLERHSFEWHLTDRGIEQAKAAGSCLREEARLPFDVCMTSEYVRAMETAAYLEIPDAQWHPYLYLRERSLGELEALPFREKQERFGESLERRQRYPYLWRAEHGEALEDLSLKWDRIQQILHRKYSMQRALVVTHEGVLWEARHLIERLPVSEMDRLIGSHDPKDRIHNCQILHYTRRDPVTGKLNAHLDWMRSICPWDTSLSTNEWQPIERKTYSNTELLEMASHYPRLFST